MAASGEVETGSGEVSPSARCLPRGTVAALAVAAVLGLAACGSVERRQHPELEFATTSDGVTELHIHTREPYRIIVHKTGPQGQPTTTTILLNGAKGAPAAE